jgi:hypothetical protein
MSNPNPNPNLSNRVICVVLFFLPDFPDYDGDELNQISGLLARDYGYNYPADARYKKLFVTIALIDEVLYGY